MVKLPRFLNEKIKLFGLTLFELGGLFMALLISLNDEVDSLFLLLIWGGFVALNRFVFKNTDWVSYIALIRRKLID